VAEKKSSIDLVTDADLLSEQLITAALRERWPDALIVGEEAYESNRGAVAGLRDAELAFVIDPVDGTFNFQAGLPIYGTNFAVTRRGETIAAIIHESVLGDTLMAIKGAGAWLLGSAGTRDAVSVAAPVDLSAMVGTVSINDLGYPERRRIAGNLAKTRMAFGYNCSAYEYWMVATGKVHFIGHHSLMPGITGWRSNPRRGGRRDREIRRDALSAGRYQRRHPLGAGQAQLGQGPRGNHTRIVN
jgi:Archaeal fructose-1,6-bisphosphatase and related enzymes of inositol monophosphatase family